MQPQSSGAEVIGFASAGDDSSNLIKQAAEFGLANGKAKLAALLCFIPQIHALGLQASKGLLVSEAFYWDLNDGTRALTERYAPQVGGAKPCTIQAGCYSGVLHYLKAAAALGFDNAKKSCAAVAAKMKEMPTDDLAFGKGGCGKTAARSTTCVCSRSWRRKSREALGLTTTSLGPFRARRRFGRSPTGDARLFISDRRT